MTVVLIENGVVTRQMLDVGTIHEAVSKYPDLDGQVLIEAEHAPGTMWDGEVFSVPPITLPVPQTVTKLQLYDALDDIGLDLDVLLEGLPPKGKRRFELAIEVNREDPLIGSLAASLGWTSEQVDNLFRDAAAR